MRKTLLFGMVFLFLLSFGVSAELKNEWLLDEISGTNAEDNVGTNDGTASNSRVFTSEVEGISNTGADFTQGDDYISIGTLPDVTGSFTFSVWAKKDTSTSTIVVMGTRDSTTTNPDFDWKYLYMTEDDDIGFMLRGPVGINRPETTTGNYTVGNWYHIVGTYDSATTTARLYVDGNLVGTDTTDPGTINPYQTYIGRISLGNYFDGDIDEVRVYDSALSTTEVEELHEYYVCPPNFEITAKDIYTNNSIDSFNATITNSTDTTTFNTTNGTITWEYGNEELLNITISSDNFFDRTYTNYNTTTNLEANLSNLVITNVTDIYNNETINNFSILYDGNTFNTTNGTLRTNLDNPLRLRFIGVDSFETNFDDWTVTGDVERLNNWSTLGDWSVYIPTSEHIEKEIYVSESNPYILFDVNLLESGFNQEVQVCVDNLRIFADRYDCSSPIYTIDTIGESSNVNVSLESYIGQKIKLQFISRGLLAFGGGVSSYAQIDNIRYNEQTELHSFTLQSDNYFDKQFNDYNTSNVLNTTLWNKINNILNFTDSDSNPIDNATITITRPDESTLTKTTNSTGQIQFDFQENFSIIQGDYTFQFPSTQGYISPITFTETVNESQANIQKEYELYKANLNINIYDRATLNLLTNPTQIIMQGVFNATTNNGTYAFQNLTLSPDDYTIQTISDGYDTEQQTFTFNNQENLTLNFYMLNLTDENAGTLFVSVIDDFFRTIQDATVKLLEYNVDDRAYIKVSECTTNSNGECSFTIELNKKTYILRASKIIDKQLYSAESNPSGEIIKTDNEVRNLVLRPDETFDLFVTQNLLLSVEETFENNISTIFLEFTTLDNLVGEVCVEYYEVVNRNRTSVYEQCVVTSDSYSATPILLNRSNTYEAEVYLKTDSNYVFYTFRYPSDRSLQEILSTNNFISPLILLLWVMIIAFMFKLENVTILAITGIIVAWMEWMLFPSMVNASGSVLKTMILIFMFYISRKKEDFN